MVDCKLYHMLRFTRLRRLKILSSNTRIKFTLTLVIILAYSVDVESDNKVRLGENCDHHTQCVSKKCMPLCSTSSKVCGLAGWFYERHGLEFPVCIKNDDDNPHWNSRRKVGESCHNDANCESKNCIVECSSKKWQCIDPKSFYQEKNMNHPYCAEEKTSDMLKKATVSLGSKENPADMLRKATDSLGSDEKTSDVMKMATVSLGSEEKTSDMLKRATASVGSRHLGQFCTSNDDCVTGNCVPLCEEVNPNFYCIKPRWSFEMYSMEVPSCLDREKLLRLEKLLSVKDDSVNELESAKFNQIIIQEQVDDSQSAIQRMGTGAANLQNDTANSSKRVLNDSREKTAVKESKIGEAALLRLKQGGMKLNLEAEPVVVKKSVISIFFNEMFTFLFGFHVIAFFFLVLPFVLLILI